MTNRWLGIDIGGANIKLAGEDGRSRSIVFPLWKSPGDLATILRDAFEAWPSFERLAVTMTGELADCFRSKEEGVRHICESVIASARGKQPVFYQTTGSFVPEALAKKEWQATAAANWHALAQWIGHQFEHALLIDMGSTTTDVIPISNGKVRATGRTDLERLYARELLYTGVVRSPVCAVLNEVQMMHGPVQIAQELFATMADVYLVLGSLPEQPDCCETADGCPATKNDAERRLARMVCADMTEISEAEILTIARAAMQAQRAVLRPAICNALKVLPLNPVIVVLGEGHWLVNSIVTEIAGVGPVIGAKELLPESKDQRCGDELARCSPAWALACLAGRMENELASCV